MIGFSIKKINQEHDDRKIPLMGVMGAFIFAAQMINFTIPGTGSSGHIGGGILLCLILGQYPAFLSLCSVLIIQCLFFGDGGLLALGCNIFNMGILPCFVAYPLIVKPLLKKNITSSRVLLASILGVVVGLEMGAFAVVLQTLASNITESQFRRGTFEKDPPGSTFKVITAAAALTMQEDENLDDSFLQFNDSGSYIPAGSDFVITNFQNQVFGTIDMNTALAKSCNCYFADLGIRVGAEKLSKMMNAFMVGKDITIPYLDTIHSSYNIGNNDNAELAQTAFGQGNTTITPLHIAMMAQAIANDGIMLQPHIVKSIQSNGRTLYRSSKNSLSTTTTHSVNEKLKEYMHSAALEYGLTESGYGMVYAKTGTAECANNRIHSYMMGFTDRYSFCISANNNNGSAELYGIGQKLVKYLNNLY